MAAHALARILKKSPESAPELAADHSDTNPFQVVLAIDQKDRLEHVSQLLSQGGHVNLRSISGEAELVRTLDGEPFDCVLIGNSKGAESCFGLMQAISERVADPPPIVLLAGESSVRTAIKAFRVGFSDYVLEAELGGPVFASRVRAAAKNGRNRNRIRAEMDQLSRLARRDSLTGLLNRGSLDDRLEVLVERGGRHGKPFALMLLDLNKFKHINDDFGHAIGDRALKEFARRLQQAARGSDTFGRYGGDEFLYVVDSAVSISSVRLACERLHQALTFTLELDQVGLSITSSIGAAIYPIDGTTVDELLHAADSAMYHAKRSGEGIGLASDRQSSLASLEDPENPLAPDGLNLATANDDTVEAASAKTANQAGMSEAISEDQIVPADAPRLPDAASVPTPSSVHRIGDRRSEHRHRVLKKARIEYNSGLASLNCILRDLTQRGARVVLPSLLTVLPDEFMIVIVESGARFLAQRRWQNGTHMGVEFVEVPAAAGTIVERPPTTSTEARPAATAGKTPSVAPLRAFVVEDDDKVSSMIVRALSRLGYSSARYSRLAEIEAAMSIVRPDLLCLDLSLGDTDAVDVLRMAARSRFDGRVILMSGHDVDTLEEVKRIGQSYGLTMLPFLQKPFRIHELNEIVGKADGVAPDATSSLLGEALRNNWLEVWYQPKIDLRSMTVHGRGVGTDQTSGAWVAYPRGVPPLARQRALSSTVRSCDRACPRGLAADGSGAGRARQGFIASHRRQRTGFRPSTAGLCRRPSQAIAQDTGFPRPDR